MTGIVMQLATLAGIILGAIFAGFLSDIITPNLIEWSGGNSKMIGIFSYIIVFLLIFLALFLIGKMITKAIKAIQLNSLNRLAGAIFCTVKWLFLISILLNILVEIDKNKIIIKEDIRENSYTYHIIKDTAPAIIPYLRFEWVMEYK